MQPTATVYAGDDPDGYALAVNLDRRFLTKGQKAMVVARAGALSQSTLRVAGKANGVSDSRLGYASTVLTHAPDLADSVAAGTESLDAAYKVARERKQAADAAPLFSF